MPRDEPGHAPGYGFEHARTEYESGGIDAMSGKSGSQEQTASQQIDARIEELDDWRGSMLSRLRALIKQADPDAVEEWKWVKPKSGGTAVWAHDGGICTGEVYKNVVKLTF